jgi:1-deoxy-D-xylulose-5-phosphate synthase
MGYRYPDQKSLIQKVKSSSLPELEVLAADIRARILETVGKNGGHLASNLGTVELTIALYRNFDFPEEDILVWDTGHQAYTHKILTDRADRFHTLRQYGGISGFTSRSESPFDSYGAGHVGTGVGVGLGFEQAFRKEGHEGNVVVVVGDGALTNGVTLEALNQAAYLNSTLRVVINDNGMSIGENVGSFARSFSLLRTNPAYASAKQKIKTFLMNTGLEPFETILEKIRDSMKSYIVPRNYFESMGFKYIGPIDGHDIDLLSRVFYNLKIDFRKPTIVHVITKKGKGTEWSESQPRKYHGIGPFHIEDGSPLETSQEISFSQAFGKTLTALAVHDPKLVTVTAAMEDGTGLSSFKNRFPDRFFDLGITETFCSIFSSAFALRGWHPVFAVYSTFLQRAYDSLVHDIALQKIPVLFGIDRAGIVGDDGPTHHGLFDMGFLLSLPGVTIYNPRNIKEMVSILKYHLQIKWPEAGPVFLRYPKMTETIEDGVLDKWIEEPENGACIRWQCVAQRSAPCVAQNIPSLGGKEIPETLIFSTGQITSRMVEICPALPGPYTVINAVCVKPLDWECIDHYMSTPGLKYIVTAEEAMAVGGFGQHLFIEVFKRYGFKIAGFKNLGFPDTFIEHGKNEMLLKHYRLDTQGLLDEILHIYETRYPRTSLVSVTCDKGGSTA